MAVDFTKYRVDVDRALEGAISSRDTNAVQTETTNQMIRAHSSAFERAGSAIREGLAGAFDPTKNLAKQTALKNAKMQEQENARLNAGLAARGNARYMKAGEVLGTDVSNIPDIGKKIFQGKAPGGVPYEQLPPDTRQRFEGRLSQITQQDQLINQLSDKEALALGPEHGSEKNIGSTMARGRQKYVDWANAAYEELTNDPAYQKLMLEVNERRQEQADLGAKGDYIAVQGYKDHPNNKELQKKFVPYSSWVRNGEMMMTPWGAMTPLQLNARGFTTVAHFHNLMRSSVNRYPAMAIDGAGDKATVKTTWDEEVIKRAAAKDSGNELFAKALSGQPLGKAYSTWSGYLGSQEALNRLTNEKADWRKKLTGTNATLMAGKIAALRGHIAKYGIEAVAAEVGNLSGVAETQGGVMLQANVLGKKGSMDAVRKNLAAIKALSPGAEGLLTKSLDPSKPSEIEILTAEAYENGMAEGPFDAGPGPLAPFKNMGIDEGDLAVMSESVMPAFTAQPDFGVLQSQLQFGGMPSEAARRLATENYPQFQAAMERGFSTPDSKGVMPSDWPKAEQDGLKRDIAEDFASTHVHEYRTARDVENAETMNWLSGKPEGQMPYSDALVIANAAIKANPDHLNRSVDLEQKDGSAIRVHRGDPIAQRLPNGKWETLKNQDPYQQRYTESLHIGSRIYADRMEEAKKRGNTTPGKGSSGDPRIDAIMGEMMPNGGSVYDYASNLLNQHPTMGSKSDDWGGAIATHLTNKAAEQGFKSFDFSRALNEAAERTRDPVLDGLAAFVAENISPQPNTRKMLDMAKGTMPTDMIRGASEAQAKEETDKKLTSGGGSAADFLAKSADAAASRPSEPKPPKDWTYPDDPVYEKSWQEKQDEELAKGDPEFGVGLASAGGTGLVFGPAGAAVGIGAGAWLESERVRDVREARERIDLAKNKAAYEGRFGAGTWETGGQPEPEPKYEYGWQAKGIKVQGNLNLTKQPVLKYRDGSVSTVRTTSISTDQGEVLIPTIIPGEKGAKAKKLTDQEAIEHYKKTGEHFGIFESKRAANMAAKQIHDQQERLHNPKKPEAAAESRPESGPASRPESRPESRPSPAPLKGKAPESRPAPTQAETHALAMGRTFGSTKTREEQAREYAEEYRVQGGGLSDKDIAAYAKAKREGVAGAAESETMHKLVNKISARQKAGPDKSTSPGRRALINQDRSKPDAKGRIAEGNIDLNDRVGMVDEQGRTATVRSISIEVNGREVLIPTISPVGTPWTDREAIDHYYRSGKHLGIYKDVDSANRAAEELHLSEEKKFEHTPRLTSISAGPRPSILNPPGERTQTQLDVFQEAERRAQEIRRKEKGPPTREEFKNRPREMMNAEDKMFPIERTPIDKDEPVDWNWKPGQKKKEEKKKEDKKKESPNRRSAPVGEPRYGAG